MKPIRQALAALPLAVASLALAVAGASAQPRDDEPATVQSAPRGAGSTFAAPIIDAWLADYRAVRPGFEPSYEAIGSGSGVTGFLAGALDFAATDAPVPAERLPADALQLPVTAGMISIVYNLPDIETALNLTRDVYSDIFLGRVSRWDDPRIVASNPGVPLPAKLIQIVARQDGSGTTFAFTNHLAAVSEAWREGPGIAKSLDWPGATMLARGNEGVAQRVRLTSGAIGYVESVLASRLKMSSARLENASGAFVAPRLSAGQAALSVPEGDAANAPVRVVVDPVAEGAYPIVTYTWWLQHRGRNAALTELLRWALEKGQAGAEPLGYLPLSDALVKAALAELDGASS